MKRRLFNIAALASLAICVAACAELVRGVWRSDGVLWSAYDPVTTRRQLCIASFEGGEFVISIGRYDYGPRRHLDPTVTANGWHGSSETGDGLYWNTWPFRIWHRQQTIPFLSTTDDINPKAAEGWGIGVRLWLVILSALVLPAIWLILARQKAQAQREGFCAVCGFDLRATPDRCPECGTPVVADLNSRV